MHPGMPLPVCKVLSRGVTSHHRSLKLMGEKGTYKEEAKGLPKTKKKQQRVRPKKKKQRISPKKKKEEKVNPPFL